jgi:hypothetical protein
LGDGPQRYVNELGDWAMSAYDWDVATSLQNDKDWAIGRCDM